MQVKVTKLDQAIMNAEEQIGGILVALHRTLKSRSYIRQIQIDAFDDGRFQVGIEVAPRLRERRTRAGRPCRTER